jgi:hypothetical protein
MQVGWLCVDVALTVQYVDQPETRVVFVKFLIKIMYQGKCFSSLGPKGEKLPNMGLSQINL